MILFSTRTKQAVWTQKAFSDNKNTPLRFRVQQSWRWIPSRLDAVDMDTHKEKHGPRCALFVGKYTPSAHRHTDHFPAAGSRQARERKPDNVFRKQCYGELAPKLGSDQSNYGQDLSETGPHLARLRILASRPDPQEIRSKRDFVGDFTVNAREPQRTLLQCRIPNLTVRGK